MLACKDSDNNEIENEDLSIDVVHENWEQWISKNKGKLFIFVFVSLLFYTKLRTS
jgi:hypothetical protein